MAAEITIKVALVEGGEPREITLRRPTLAELDVTLLVRLVANCGRLAREMAAVDSAAAKGAAIKSANLLWLVGETGEEICRRVKACLDATAPAALLEEISALEAGPQTAVLFAIAHSLIAALMPVAALPK